MIESVLFFLRGLPPSLTTLIIAALPFVEIRLSVPVALEIFRLPAWHGALLSFIGSSIPAVLLPMILEPLEKPARRSSKTLDRMFIWVRGHVSKRYTDRYRALGLLGLTLFIAIPLPVTGVWTGSLAAWVFQIRKREAIPGIVLGTGISTLIVTMTTMGFFGAIRWLL